MAERHGTAPLTVATSARMRAEDMSCEDLRQMVRDRRPLLLLFGTAWGLADEVLEQADHRLTPIQGGGDYNHLSVRSAVAILLDRILGQDCSTAVAE